MWVVSVSVKGQERRVDKRYACCGPVKVIDPKSHVLYPATILDISLSGCALRVQKQGLVAMEAGGEVELHFTTSYFSFRVLGSIRGFSADEHLLRVKFVQLNQRGWSDIIAFIRDQGDEWAQPASAGEAQVSAA